jgi:ligand-binding SRPBCC domain-containing protein
MRYRHVFTVQAPLERVSAFHRRSAGMGDLTPPPIIVRVHQAPELLTEGSEMDFTLWLGPLPVRWLARIEQVAATGFLDRQLRGPFAKWEHRHTFREASGDGPQTEVIDEIEAEVKPHPLWGLVGLSMWIGMPVLFAYRKWKTKKSLT